MSVGSAGLVDHGRMLDALGVEGKLVVAAAHEADPDVPVPGASGRTVRETVWHLVDLYVDCLGWLGTSERTIGNHRRPVDTRREDFGRGTERLTARLAELLAEFGTRPPQERCPTWWPEDGSTGFWLRRILHATTVH